MSLQLDSGQPMSCLVDHNLKVESREPRKGRSEMTIVWFFLLSMSHLLSHIIKSAVKKLLTQTINQSYHHVKR